MSFYTDRLAVDIAYDDVYEHSDAELFGANVSELFPLSVTAVLVSLCAYLITNLITSLCAPRVRSIVCGDDHCVS